MAFEKLRITGQDGQHYRLGEPMEIHDRDIHLGTLDPITVNRDGTEVLIQRFVPAAFVKKEHKRNFGPLVLLEVTTFLAEQFPRLQAVSYLLSREIEMHGDGMNVAMARSVLLQALGAEAVTIAPHPHSTTPGDFLVQGVWTYSERNLAALSHCLERERAIYRQWDEAADASQSIHVLRDRLRQLLARGPGVRGGEAVD